MKEVSLTLYRSAFYMNESGSNKRIIRLNNGLNIKRFIDSHVSNYEGLYFLYKDRKVIGQFEFFSEDNSLWSVRIDDNFRGKGYGFIFLNEFLKYIKKNTEIKEIKLNVYKDNKVAINLYKKLGFEIIGENKCSFNSFVMEVKL
jgi:ribosomal protein S18 acetylase RimI-like enzyme